MRERQNQEIKVGGGGGSERETKRGSLIEGHEREGNK
jgi:hypothetical protein